MALRQKLILLMICSTLIGLAFLYFAAQSYIIESFADIEDKNMRLNMKRVLNALADDLTELDSKVTSYAASDDVYNFMYSNELSEIEANMGDDMFNVNRLNFLMIINTDGEVVYEKGFNLQTSRSKSIPDNLKNSINHDPFLTAHRNEKDIHSGIMMHPEGPILVAAHPIVGSSFSGPVAGSLVAGRFIDSAKINNLSEATLSSLEVIPYQRTLLPEGTDVKAPDSLKAAAIWTELIDKENAAAYALVHDLDGKPAVILKINEKREIFMRGNKSLMYFYIFILLAVVCLIIFVMYILDKLFLKRWGKLIHRVITIRERRDFSARAEITGNDEISKLEKEFNGMMNALEQSQQEIMALAYHDSLTMLPNRTLFYDKLNGELQEAQEQQKHVGILFIDLDNFKTVNDTYGHEIGDLLLQKVAGLLKESIRKQDTVSRLGGDEFTVLLPGVSNHAEMEEVARRIQERLSDPILIGGKQLYVTASIGASLYPDDGEDSETLIRNADRAMFQVKRIGKNNYTPYKNDIDS
ncbi:hypothetical protein CU633_02290 [Bacillus sp. V3-13]|uniref:sensor domain-containing diguanylate cyclase n=1 Tax=Bacillus sp. V3-13 TaxID=2053728 RepID=UPI000C760121|nr:diguanylate cyclase [Bacillus sp. V3-13]PLR79037.1 hypothetical protein CU633_02290 [Bacillus sp. V3-13]